MILEDKIIVKNYKCFDSSGGGFERILPINVIIGKNNSGKSTLIDLVEFITLTNKEFLEIGRDSLNPEVLISHKLTAHEISANFKANTSGGGIPGHNHFEYGKQFTDKLYTYQLEENGKKSFKNLEVSYVPESTTPINGLANTIQKPFTNKYFCNITAERDIIPENANNDIVFLPNGSGATNTIQQILNRTNSDSRLIEIELLKELNLIINPDIIFTRILVQLNNNGKWELFFENSENKRIALSKMGSGIKTVLLVLLNLIIKPATEKKARNAYVFAFEELENNLHPSLQRRLYDYIKKYSEKHSAYFFLTTHSNVVIDAFGTYKNSQLLHVENDGNKSISSTVLSYEKTKNIINDLGIKASDLLQSNGIIWVEGPSDRNYINKWLQLLAPELNEGLHYSIMFYGGKLLANLSFDFEWFNKKVIPLLKINKNTFVVIDRDGKTMNSKINSTKERISEEIGNSNFWITKGREIENYLSDTVIVDWLLNSHDIKTVNFSNDKNIKIEDNISNSNSKTTFKYNASKTVYSSEIVEFIKPDSMIVLDLKEKIELLISKIKEWNE